MGGGCFEREVQLNQPQPLKHMPITVNLRHLEDNGVHVSGEISTQELELMDVDEMMRPSTPLTYDLEIERSGENLLVQGNLSLDLDCECVRCLRPFQYPIRLDPYQVFVPLEGEDKAPVVNDLVDLTPYVREDILLAFPQHPLCEAECDRLPQGQSKQPSDSEQGKTPWDELNKLKF